MRKTVALALAISAAALLAASSGDDAVRAGNAAYARGDYASALDHFVRAELQTFDPGMVAFNKAAAYYQLGRYAEAAEHYERALEDAAGSRRARACYGLANALVHLGRESTGRPAVQLLEQAMTYYDHALRADPDFTDARANRRMAEQLLAYKQALAVRQEQSPQPHPAKPQQDPIPSKPPEKIGRPDRIMKGTKPHPPDTSGKPNEQGKPQWTDLIRAGQGSLQPLPATVQGAPLRREAALQYLEHERRRMLEDRAGRLPDTTLPFKQEKDW